MTTALDMLKSHRLQFWRASSIAECNAWMAKESQLIAHNARQRGNGSEGSMNQIRFHEGCARQIMGITDADQFYA